MRKQMHPTHFKALKYWCCLFIFSILFFYSGFSQSAKGGLFADILHYQAQLEVDIAQKSIRGAVKIHFIKKGSQLSFLDLNCGDLIIDSVFLAKSAIPFHQESRKVYLDIARLGADAQAEVEIYYHGSPTHGISFFPDAQQVYTVFSTSEWMPCRDAAEDRAAFDLNLILPKGLVGIGNGKLTAKRVLPGGRVQYSWKLRHAVPTYVFGFAAGSFQLYISRDHGVKFQYLSADYPEAALQKIFTETSDMLRFFERKAGVHYRGKCYTQILPKGSISQEMAGFAVMRNNYGQQVLDNPMEINLGAHELAHQWWGNQVTCKNWKHFWLNEGLAVFMSSAFKEYRFGRGAYLADMEVYRQIYLKVVDQGLDKPLVFPDWINPSVEDRTLVYYKGAYFFHVLREKLGDRIFWRAIRSYTRKHFGKSVVSKDLQTAMEKESGMDLSGLFGEWVY